MIPEEIQTVIDKYDTDEIRIYIDKTDYSQNEVVVEFTLIVNDYEEEINQEWRVIIHNAITTIVSNVKHNEILIIENHPLLLEYKDQVSSLYFSGISSNPELLFFDLYQMHYAKCENFIPFDKFINNHRGLLPMLKTGYGLLAKGPRSLMQMYSTLLEKHDVKCRLMGSHKPSFWNGHAFQEISPEAKLLYFGNSYFIGDRFVFEHK